MHINSILKKTKIVVILLHIVLNFLNSIINYSKAFLMIAAGKYKKAAKPKVE